MDKEQEKQILADSITKGLAYTENGGKPNIENPNTGKSGEMKSIFQFEPKTWHAYSKEVLGSENSPMTADNETYVVNQKVKKWIDEGKTTSQIASIWNAGNPDAYKGNVGTNSYGVKYNTPEYAKKVVNYSKQFYQEKVNETKPTNIDSSGTSLSPQTNQDSSTSSDPLNNLMNTISSVQKNNQTQGESPSIQGNALAPKTGLLPGLIKTPK